MVLIARVVLIWSVLNAELNLIQVKEALSLNTRLIPRQQHTLNLLLFLEKKTAKT